MSPFIPMNTPQKTLLAVLAITAALALGRLESVEPTRTVTTITAPAVEQYRVLDASQIPIANRQNAPSTLENVLNELAADGWRVRTTMGSTIILAR
jgi:hypothetical protein